MPTRSFLNHPGEMAARIRDADWSGHALGPPEGWPTALRHALDICLGSSFPTAIYWGRDLHVLYNDAWSTIPADRHPWALGRTARELWPDIWSIVGDQFAAVLGGAAIATYDEYLPMERDGIARETYWNYSLSPIRDDAGTVVGVFNQGNETTRVVLAERQRATEIDRLRDIFQQAPGAVALLAGPEFRFELINEGYVELVGRSDLIGRRLAEAVPEVVEQGFVDLLTTVYRTGETFRARAAEVRLARGGDDLRLVDFVFHPIRNAGGAVTDIFVQAFDVTEGARAQMALRESERRLQLALDSSIGVGIWDWDLKSGEMRTDARFARLYGGDPDRAQAGFPATRFLDAVHPDDRPRVSEAVRHTLASDSPYSEEFRLNRADGTLMWVAAQGRVVRDEDGEPIRFAGVNIDITQRREAEESARAAADDLRIATETQGFIQRLSDRLRSCDTVDAILAQTTAAIGQRLGTDRVGFYRVADGDTAQFVACWTSGDLAPLTGTMPIAEFGAANVARYRAGETLHFDDYAKAPSLAGLRIGSLAGAGIGVPLLRGGQWAACLFVNHAQPRRWSADEIALVESVAQITWDAVDRAAAVEALRDSEAKFRAIADSIDQMVWSTRPDGFHDYYNERWYDYTGVPHGSTDGEAWNGMFHPDDQDRAWATWQHSLETGDSYRIEYRLRHHSGQYRWVLGRAQPVRDEGGAITRWFGTCTDIQEIVEAREVLARSRAELEAAVAERTEQLMAAEEQLRQAQKMEAVGQLTGGIAHDFNNMLAVVIGGLDLLERRLAQGHTDVQRYIDAARDGASRAAALTQRLLAFARRQPLAPVTVDLDSLIAGMVDLLTRTIGDHIVVETRFDAAECPVIVDPSQLENAILNLAVNARDAMPDGGRLTIATSCRPIDETAAASYGIGAGDYVEIAVTDTGTGMPPEIIAKAFDPFFTTKSVGKGTGLGLSQVFGFVRQSGGHIGLESTPGAGTVVRLLLPRDHGEAPPVLARSSGKAVGGARHEIVLVVEDDDRVRSYSVEALRELGYSVVHAPDGETALAMIDNGQPVHLLFSDVIMPEMTGGELAEAARRRLPALRVLFTSGYTGDAITRGGPLADAVLAKPFDVATLSRRVRAALDG